MEEIIYLEPDEEITSVIDKLKRLAAVKIGLVVPRGATLLQSVINLRLLSKEADNQGKEIAIITGDQIGRNLAAQVGLTVYGSINERQPLFQPKKPQPVHEEVIELNMSRPIKRNESKQDKDDAGLHVHHFQEKFAPNVAAVPESSESGRHTEESKPPINDEVDEYLNDRAHLHSEEISEEPLTVRPLSNQKFAKNNPYSYTRKKNTKEGIGVGRVILPIIVILIVLGGIAAYLILPKAEVRISVIAEDLRKTLNLTVSEQVSQADSEQTFLPGELIEITKESSGKFSTTGQKNIGGKAKGSITVYNSWESSTRNFPAGTKFSNSSKIFIASKAFSVPGTAIREGNLVPGTATVAIEAENSGEEYNVKAGRFTIIGLSAAQQDKIYGNSTANLSGGFSKVVQVVSKQDFDDAKSKLAEKVNADLESELMEKSKNKKVLEKAIVKPELEMVSSAKVDDEAKEFDLKVVAKCQVLAFDFNSYKNLIAEILEKQVDHDKMVAIPSDDSIATSVEKTAYDKGEMTIAVDVAAKIAPKTDNSKLAEQISGKSVEEAESLIKDGKSISRVNFSFTPEWLPKRLPVIQQNIKIDTEYITE